MSNQEREQLKPIIDKIAKALPDAIVEQQDSFGDLVLVVERGQIHDVLKSLKTEGFDMLMDIAGVDLLKLEHKERFRLVYIVYSLSKDLRLRLNVPVPEDDMNVPSAIDLWHSANWAEREAYDQFGFNFEGHPNLERILNHREFVGHPLRKDYPVMKGQWATTTADLMPDLERE